MTTMVLSAAGAAIGGAIGGSVFGLSSVAIGRFVGGVAGRAIDQRILGSGGAAVETGRIDRYRITGSAEGRAVSQVYGRMRIAGHVIWATRFQETAATTGGGKGAPPQPKRTEFSYSVSLAIALCEGEISGVTRLWADGREISMQDVTMRVYPGDDTQLPDPKIEAVEGAGTVPAYRGTAYVVFEDLELGQFGNRIPQFSFEVSRPSPKTQFEADIEPALATRAVALIPGTGEYALATEQVYYENGPGRKWAANVNSPSGQADFVSALNVLESDLPNCEAASLIVSWFGNDLRCGECLIRPMVEKDEFEGSMPWRVAGLTRGSAEAMPTQDERPIYGGTPTDQSVIQAIEHMHAQGKAVMYYPFILMDQLDENGLPDPWTGADDQPVLPWRGRVTLSVAPGQAGSPDGTAVADAEVADFFGTAAASDFAVSDGNVTYSGPNEWRYRRFILHQAALCKAAGGVESFCIGSEMRGLTWIRGAGAAFVAVNALIDLLNEVRSVLGPDVKLSYAADWSEYFGYQPQDGSGNRYFHLDALWADEDIDFIGIDNYMPLSDWRDGSEHADAGFGSIYDLDYLSANIEGGEGYDWYYHSEEAREAQIRTPITDGAHGEPWIYRYKDVRNWWENAHHARVGGARLEEATDWEPRSKPIVFTELGCAAIDKGTNQPNKFLDPKSSESTAPHYSNGQPDEYIQHQYLKAQYRYWGDETNNPVSEVYGGPMIDMSRAFVWAWDSRPFPWFPRNSDLWSDGDNFRRGHWLSGRASHRSLASVVREICERAGVRAFDVSGLQGMVRGFATHEVGELRRSLQPLMLRYGFDAVERAGVLTFVMRGKAPVLALDEERLAVTADLPVGPERMREAEAETVGRVRLEAVSALADYETLAEEGVFADDPSEVVSQSELNIVMERGEARQVAERWLAESRLAQDTVRFALPMSKLAVRVGDVVSLLDANGAPQTYRIDRMEVAEAVQCEATRVSERVYQPRSLELEEGGLPAFNTPIPMTPLFMDLPLITGDELPHSPHVVAVADPWPGEAAIYSAVGDSDFRLNTTLPQAPIVGVLENDLMPGTPGAWDRSLPFRVRMITGNLQSVDPNAVLEGANVAAIGDGSPDNWEVMQFGEAELIGPDTYAVSICLRGQNGSGRVNPSGWPAGSWFVLLDQNNEQLDLPAASLGLERTYRVGPASRPASDPIYAQESHAFAGNGLRPYAPVHLRAIPQVSGDIEISWIRRTRVGGDNWGVTDVPLGEEVEAYVVEIYSGGALLRREELKEARWTYAASDQSDDGVNGVIEIHVAQVSALYGPGHAARTQIAIS